MKNQVFKLLAITIFVILGIVLLLSISSCTNKGDSDKSLQAKVDSLENVIKKMTDEKEMVEKNLKLYDSLDMAFNKKDLKLVGKYYDKDILAHMNDGTKMSGYDAYEKDLKKFFENWPDMKAESTILKFGSGEWTVAIDDVTGSFTKPMTMGGKTIQPNGKHISMNFVTFAKWKDGKIVEEYDFGNDWLFMKQLGLDKK